MKKVVVFLLCVMAVCFGNEPVYAKTSITGSLTSNVKEDKIKRGEEVVVTLSFSDYEEIKKGINSYKATLQYDKKIFEEVEEADMVCKSDWENLRYNKKTGEFIAIKKNRTKVAEDVVAIRLTAKEDADIKDTTITLKNITASEGKEDIVLNDVSKTLNIVTSKDVVKPVSNGKTNSTNKNNSSTNKSDDDKQDNDLSNKDDQEQLDKDNESDDNKQDNDNDEDKVEEKDNKEDKDNIVYIFIVGAIIIAVGSLAYYFGKKSNEVNNSNNNNKNNNLKMLAFFVMGSIFFQLLGSSVVNAQGLFVDEEYDYDQVQLLLESAIHLVELSDDDLATYDVNNDGKITVTDLTLVVQVIEDILDYDVVLSNIEFDSYYPTKSDDIRLSFNARVAYGADIRKIVINNQEYDVQKVDNKYMVELNAGINAGVRDFRITEAILDNGHTTEIDYVKSVDVLKNVPSIDNYVATENIRDQKFSISFDINDVDNSLVTSLSTIKVFDENSNVVFVKQLVSGRNTVEVEVLDRTKYKVEIKTSYDLDTNELDVNKDNTGVVSLEKELRLVTDYNFKLENIKTYRSGIQNTIFNKNEQIQIGFTSSNSTKYEPIKVKVNGTYYNVQKQNDIYVATIDGFTTAGNNNVVVEEAILANNKSFAVANNSVSVNISKQKPIISNFTVLENRDNVEVQFNFTDVDNTLEDAAVILYNENNTEIGRQTFTREDAISNNGRIIKRFATTMAARYKVKADVSYRIAETGDAINETLVEKDFNAQIKAVITDSVSDKVYPSKGDIIILTYTIETNSQEAVSKIKINNIDCMVRMTPDGKYKLAYQVKSVSGVEELVATEVIYKDNTVSRVDNVLKVDVLKQKPSITNITQSQNVERSEINLDFDLTDDDNSFVTGKVILTNPLDGTKVEKNVVVGHNSLSFNVIYNVDYKLEASYTYDLDANSLSGVSVDDNRTTENIIDTRTVRIDGTAILDEDSLNKCFDKLIYVTSDGTIVIRFRAMSDVDYSKIIINNKLYDLTREGDYYIIRINDMDISKLGSILLQAIVLGNKETITLDSNSCEFSLNEDLVENTNEHFKVEPTNLK